jgi:hypothetical protein
MALYEVDEREVSIVIEKGEKQALQDGKCVLF